MISVRGHSLRVDFIHNVIICSVDSLAIFSPLQVIVGFATRLAYTAKTFQPNADENSFDQKKEPISRIIQKIDKSLLHFVINTIAVDVQPYRTSGISNCIFCIRQKHLALLMFCFSHSIAISSIKRLIGQRKWMYDGLWLRLSIVKNDSQKRDF